MLGRMVTSVNLGTSIQTGEVDDLAITTAKLANSAVTVAKMDFDADITLADGAAGTISLTPDTTGIVDIKGSMNPSVSSTGKALIMGF